MICTARRCGRTTGDGMYLCHDCTGKLERHLNNSRGLESDLLVMFTRQTAASQGPGGSSGETALPYDWKASDILSHMEGLTGDWARCISEDSGEPLTCRASWLGYAQWLLGNVNLIRRHAAAADALDEMGSAYNNALRAVDLKPERRYAGPCPTCTSPIWGIRGSDSAFCRECGQEVATEAHMMERLGQAWEHEANPTVIVRALNAYGIPVKLGTVQSWVHRGELLPSRELPSKLYRVSDVYGLCAERSFHVK